MSQYLFEIRPNGAEVAVILRGDNLPALGQEFSRTLPNLDNADIDSFRSGQIDPVTFGKLSNAVSGWLLDPDLRQTVRGWLGAPNADLRLIFAVNSALQSRLADVPIELLQTDAGGHHLVVHARVKSLVHVLPKVGVPSDATVLEWPLRVLLVRSNPSDISGGRVPEAAPFRKEILEIAEKQFGHGHVEVDLLSSEPGAQTLGLPSFRQFRDTVDLSDYDILVYLGHGDLEQVHQDLPPISLLQFERGDGLHEPVNSQQLAAVLHRRPIPVVVLAGCLTAVAPGDQALAGLPVWMRGNQGMAQALVNSESGVFFAVGMRCQVDADDALAFLERFFTSLLKINKGNVEMAVSAGRAELFQRKPLSASWAAPMAFSSLRKEPLLEYMTKDPRFVQSDKMKLELNARSTFVWPFLAEQKAATRSPMLAMVVQKNRQQLSAGVRENGAMLLPELVDEAQPNTTVTVPVTLEGALSCGELLGKFILGSGLRAGRVRETAVLTAAGFELFDHAVEPGYFIIRSKGKNIAPLPEGPILELELSILAEARGICLVNLDVTSSDSAQSFWAGYNAVIVFAA